ncbi:hypothetical protein DFH09DRAFT_849252, partial [Mycena vulgaris]
QILVLVADNASNNNTLVSELGLLITSYRGSTTRVRCFAHILNLVVKVKYVHLCYSYHANDGAGHPLSV